MNLSTGQFVPKRDRRRPVTCLHEGSNGDGVTHILPLMTQPFVFRAMRTLVPRWEELLIFNESFDHVRESQGDDLAIFFLVQDFVSMSKVRF